MIDIFKISLLKLHPSQLYINETKLQKIKGLQPEQLGPLPVILIREDIVLTDGHTRAFHAWLSGRESIDVYWDLDELDMNVYFTCYAWCEEQGIRTIQDFKGRVIPNNDYQRLWIDRCHQII